MLKKLLKYDFKELLKVCMPLYGIGLILAIAYLLMNNISTNMIESAETPVGLILSLLVLLISQILVFGIALIAILVSIWIVLDFSKSVYGKRGYLTHTLPVSTAEIFWSKSISGSVMSMVTAVVVLVLNFIAAHEEYAISYHIMIDGIKEIYAYAKGEFNYIIIGTIILSIIILVKEIMTIYGCISLGHLTKQRVVMGIIIYLIVNNVLNIITFVPGILYFVIKNLKDQDMNLGILMDLGHGIMITNLISILITVVFGYITYRIMDKKLNLI